MDKFARTIIGYHGCRAKFARQLLLGSISTSEWQPSRNDYDWLGTGIYFWEHSPTRAFRWAKERYGKSAAVIGAIIQLGACFDLMDEEHTSRLARFYMRFRSTYSASNVAMPQNRGQGKKRRELDRAVINECLEYFESEGTVFDVVRGAFLEGLPIFEGTTISAETHIQLAVRNSDCIVGVFRPE